MTAELEIFCRLIRSRSAEHEKAISVLYYENLFGQCVSILRQELDSLVRVIYLLTIDDRAYRKLLIKSSIEGQKWKKKNGKSIITDREMVEISSGLHGWTKSVYLFGCAFIHLSSFHDYEHRNPLEMITKDELKSILSYMRGYHGGPLTDNPTFMDLAFYFPAILNKISSNLECYIQDLEQNLVLNSDNDDM